LLDPCSTPADMPTAEDTLFQRFGKEFPKGTVLFHEGETGKEMFVLQAGKVVITKTVRDTVKTLATLGPGEFFGEMALISNRPRNATATVEEAARLLVIDPKTFEGMIRGNTEIAVRMIKKLAERLDEADAQIENLLLADPGSRVVHQVLHAVQTRGRPTEEGVEIDLNVRELPRLTGVGEAGIRAELQRMERSGLVERAGDRLLVRDPARLGDYLQLLALRWKFGEP
jgi:CRP/FNR family transcriptional regulator, cyclic AMP receptor protein